MVENSLWKLHKRSSETKIIHFLKHHFMKGKYITTMIRIAALSHGKKQQTKNINKG